MEALSQLITIAAVLLGGLTSFVTTRLSERANFRRALATRWDGRRLDAYVDYVGSSRAQIHAAVLLYEARHGLRQLDSTVTALAAELMACDGRRALAFERVMMLAGQDVIEASHDLNRAVLEIDWRSRDLTQGDIDAWRQLHRQAFSAINVLHGHIRVDLGVSGGFDGESHGSRDLLLPSTGSSSGSGDREGA